MPWKKDPRHTIIGGKHRARSRYAMIANRLANTHLKKNRGYEGIELRVTKEEFVEWFTKLDFKGCSVHRIDSSGHYELSNMQVIPLAANIRKDKAIAADGKCRCFVCKETKPETDFAVDKRRANGFTTICKACDAKRVRAVSPEARERRAQKRKIYYQTVIKPKQQQLRSAGQ